MHFCYFTIHLPSKRAWHFIWINLNILTQGCFVSSSVKIGSVVFEKKTLKFRKCVFCYKVMISPWKRAWPFIWPRLKSITKECFVSYLVKIGLVVLDKKKKMWNVYDKDDVDDGQKANCNQKSSLEPLAQVSE